MLIERTLTLSTPIKSGNDEISEIILREPTAGNLKAIQNYDGHDLNIRLISMISNPKLDPIVIGNLSFRDYRAAVKLLDELMERDDASITPSSE